MSQLEELMSLMDDVTLARQELAESTKEIKDISQDIKNYSNNAAETEKRIVEQCEKQTAIVNKINKRSVQNRLGDAAIGGLVASIIVLGVIFYLTTWLNLDTIEKYNLATNYKELNEKSAEEFKALKEYKELALFLKKRNVSYYDLTKFEDNRCNIIIPQKYIDNSRYPNTKNKDVCIIFKK